MTHLKMGDVVDIAFFGQRTRGTVKLASANGRSLMLEFETILGGYVGMMPVLQDDDGLYRDLRLGEPVELLKVTP